MIDSHAHYTHDHFAQRFCFLTYDADGYAVVEGGREDIFARMEQAGITDFVEPAIDLDSNAKMLAFCKECNGRMHVAVGVHPTCVYATKWKDRKQLETFVKEEGVVAVGEAGLDFHYARKDQHRFWQKRWFIYQIKLAYEHKFPLVLHIRRADKAGMRILKRYKDKLVGGVLHCFNSGADVARQGVELGLYFGIGGALIGPDEERSARLREALTVIPLERILLETDAPFVLPQCLDQTGAPVSPKVRNASTVILAVAEEIARIKGVDLSTVQEVTTENAKKLFGI